MNYFSSIEEKGQYYISGDSRIDDFDKLIDNIENIEQENGSNALFRGQPEARLMLYSSLQRLWIDKRLENHYESYRQLIDNLIKTCKEWNFGLISKYLRNAGWEENELSILSIMQHYGVPTPLLDFTYDINKSLFFATLNIDLSPPATEIDEYFSIYYIYKKNSLLSFSRMMVNELLDSGRKKKIINEKDLNSTMQYDLALIDNTDQAYRIQNNLNILNQEGAFVFNSSPVDPLEVHYLKWMNIYNQIMEKKEDQLLPSGKLACCLNINKGLTSKIREFLARKGIDRYSMFPDLNQMRTDCLNTEWKSITEKNKSMRTEGK